MVQLKHLEKSLEAALSEGSIKAHEAAIDGYLNDHEFISPSASTRLHDFLHRLWTTGLSSMREDSSGTLTPASTRTAESAASAAAPEPGPPPPNARVTLLEALVRLAPCIINTENLLVWWDELSVYAIDSTGHQIEVVNLSQDFVMGVLKGSFYEHADPEIADLVFRNSRAYGAKILELYVSHALPLKSVGEATSERVRYVRQNCRIFFGHYGRKETSGAFTLLNDFFVEPKYRLDILNLVVEYFSQSQNSKLFKVYDTAFFESLLQCLEHDKTRAVLQLALTALAMCIVHVCDKLVPTRLLFRVYACFGRACSWQPDVANILGSANDDDQDNEDDDGQDGDGQDDDGQDDGQGEGGRDVDGGRRQEARGEHAEHPDSSTSGTTSSDGPALGTNAEGEAAAVAAGRQSSGAASGKAAGTAAASTTTTTTTTTTTASTSASTITKNGSINWLSLTEDPAADTHEDEEQTIDVLPLFTFIYGLFPQNTLQFCRQCDEYMAKHNYQRTFTDYWSRFMVTKKVEALIREFRLDPLLLTSNPDTELSSSIQRFQSIGSALGITSVITSRLVSNGSDVDVYEAIDEHRRYFQALIQPLPPSKIGQGPRSSVDFALDGEKSPKSADSAKLAADSTESAAADDAAQNQSSPRSVASHPAEPKGALKSAADVEDDKRSAAYWRRELLLLRNELAFTDFRRHMSEQRALRWQKRASRWAIAELRNSELIRENQLMESKVSALKEESQRALRSARTIMRERSAYETKILDRNREFREQVASLEAKVLELKLDAEAARHAEAALSAVSQENAEKAGLVEFQLRDLRNEVETARRTKTDEAVHSCVVDQTESVAALSQEDCSRAELQFEIDNLRKERDAALEMMEKEVTALQAELAHAQSSAQNESRHRQPHLGGPGSVEESADAVARENLEIVARLKSANEELLHRCISVEHELRARKIHEEERMNELKAALVSARAFAPLEPATESRFRGRGGAQGVPRRV